jgi:hypothetical protein
MKRHQIRTITALSCSIIAIIASSCSSKSSVEAPSDDEVKNSVKLVLPAYVSVNKIETEPIAESTEVTKVNFMALLEIKEDLFVRSHMISGDETTHFIKRTQAEGSENKIYGSVMASKTVDKWSMERVNIKDGLEVLGRPRGSFSSNFLVVGSPEANAKELEYTRAKATREQQLKDESEIREQQLKDESEIREQQRIAGIERERKMNQQRKSKLLELTKAGSIYEGVLARKGGERQAIKLRFTEQNGFMIKAEFSNPDKPSEQGIFKGELIFKNRSGSRQNQNQEYYIALSPIIRSHINDTAEKFYRRKGNVALFPHGDGLVGNARIINNYELRLQPAKTK